MFTSLTSRFMGGLRGTLGGIRVIAPARIKNLLRVKEGCLGLYDLRTMSCSRLQCMKKQARIPLWPKWQYWFAGLGEDWNLSEGKWRGADSLWQRWGLVASPEDCKSQPGPECKHSRISSLSRLICHQSRCTAWAEYSHVRLMIWEGFFSSRERIVSKRAVAERERLHPHCAPVATPFQRRWSQAAEMLTDSTFKHSCASSFADDRADIVTELKKAESCFTRPLWTAS